MELLDIGGSTGAIPRQESVSKAYEGRLVGAGTPPRQIVAIWRRGRGILRGPVRGI
jgi:hypothetical protein